MFSFEFGTIAENTENFTIPTYLLGTYLRTRWRNEGPRVIFSGRGVVAISMFILRKKRSVGPQLSI